MRAHLFLSRAALAVACALSSLHTVHAQADDAPKPPKVVRNSPLDKGMFTQLLVAELHARSGNKAVGFQLMLDAARRANDEALFQRAVRMATEVNDGQAALMAMQAWRAALPKSLEGARVEVQILAALDRYAEAAEATRSMLDLTPPDERGPTFGSIPKLFANNKDRKQNVTLLEPVLKFWIDSPDTRTSASIALARLAAAAGDIPRAVELTSQAHVHERRSELPALFSLELMSSTRDADAIVLDYLKEKPDGAGVRILYARLLTSMRRYAEAATQLETVVRDQPKLAPPWLLLAAVQLELKRPADAAATATRYLAGLRDGSIVPAPARPSATGLMPAVDAGVEDADDDVDDTDAPATPAEHPSVAQALFILAKASEQQRDYAGAEAWLSRVTDPRFALDVVARRADLLVAQGKLKQAIDLVRKAPEPTPAAARTKVVLEAQLYGDAKQWAAAEAAYAAGNKRFPNDAELLYQQAMAAEKLNRLDQMERLLRRTIEINKDHYHAYNALGYSLADRRLRLPEARGLIAKALSLAPGDPLITDSLGWVEYRLGNLPEAVRLLREAYTVRPDAEIGTHLGEVLWVSGQRDEARKVLRDVRQREADNEVLKETLARLKVDL